MLFLANYYVALLAVVFSYLLLRASSKFTKVTLGPLWLLLLPNTAYLFTDFGNLIYKWDSATGLFSHVAILAQYLLLAIISIATFVFAFLPFEKLLNSVKNQKFLWLILFNFVVAFGVVLGRFEHINSNVIFTHPLRTIHLMTAILASTRLLIYMLLFGALFNVTYFVFRGWFLRKTKKYFQDGTNQKLGSKLMLSKTSNK